MHAVNNAKQICIHYSASSNLIFDYYSPWGPETNELCLEGIGPYLGELLKIAILAYFGLFYLEKLNSDFGFFTLFTYRVAPIKGLRKIAIHNFVKWGFEI